MRTTETPRDIVDRLRSDGSSWAQDLFNQAADEIERCRQALGVLQAAAEPLAALADQWDRPRSGTPSTPDGVSVPVSIGELRSLARSLRSSRGGEAEPPRSPVPETALHRSSVAGRRGQQALDLLKTIWAELTACGKQEYAIKVTTVEGIVTFLKTKVVALESEVACLEQPAATPIVDVLPMRTSAGTDYYVRIKCGDREATLYRFRDRYPAEYEAAHLAWLLGLRSDEPDLMSYDEATYPNDPATRDRVAEFQDALRKSFSEEMSHMQVLLARAMTERLRAEEQRDEARAEVTSLREQVSRG